MGLLFLVLLGNLNSSPRIFGASCQDKPPLHLATFRKRTALLEQTCSGPHCAVRGFPFIMSKNFILCIYVIFTFHSLYFI